MELILVIGAFGFVGLLIAIFGDQSSEYPPKDEKGRPMKACFSSRNGRFMWVRQSDD